MGSAVYSSGCEYDIVQSHFLDSCFLCQRPLTQDHDIFMYRGNTPFCSQECRQQEIESDEATEKRWNLSTKRSKSVRHQNSESAKESDAKNAVRIGTVAAVA